MQWLTCACVIFNMLLFGGGSTFDKMKRDNQIGVKPAHELKYYINSGTASAMSMTYFEMGRDCIEENDLVEALIWLNCSVKESPHNLVALLLYCQVALNSDHASLDDPNEEFADFGHAREYAERAADIAFDVPEVQKIIGHVYLAMARDGIEIGKGRGRFWIKRAFFAFREAAYLGDTEAWNIGKKLWPSKNSENASVWVGTDNHPFYKRWGLNH